jgi:hypothetical protein
MVVSSLMLLAGSGADSTLPSGQRPGIHLRRAKRGVSFNRAKRGVSFNEGMDSSRTR